MTLLRWALRTAARSSLDALGTALDHAASALHRAAGEPSALDALMRERAYLVAELGREDGAHQQEAERCRQERDEAHRAIGDLYDYALEVSLMAPLDGTAHMPTEIRRAIDALAYDGHEAGMAADEERTRGDRMRDAARWLAAERRELRRLLSQARKAGDGARHNAELFENERDEARAECERLRQVAREWGGLQPAHPGQGGAG